MAAINAIDYYTEILPHLKVKRPHVKEKQIYVFRFIRNAESNRNIYDEKVS